MHFGFIKDMSPRGERLIAALDIGTSKISALVAETGDIRDGRPARGFFRKKRGPENIADDASGSGVNIIGSASVPSRGIKKGEVTSIEQAVESIQRATAGAGSAAGVDIGAVYLSITGRHIGCMRSNGVIAVKEKEIGCREVDNVIEAARAVAIPFDREMLHVIPEGFSVNGQNGITDPVGMAGVRLETSVQIITASSSAIQNMLRCCERAGLEVVEIVFQPLASAEAVLGDDEKELGVAVIDIGGGTTDVAVFSEGTVSYSTVIAIGGVNFTNDLAIGLRIPSLEAEEVKKRYGCCMFSIIREDEYLDIGGRGGVHGKRIPRRYMVEILQPRAEELFTLIRDELSEKGLYSVLNSGVILTGGGVLMEGIDVMAENILELPVRIGKPGRAAGIRGGISGPEYAASVGLILRGAADGTEETGRFRTGGLKGIKTRVSGLFGGIL